MNKTLSSSLVCFISVKKLFINDVTSLGEGFVITIHKYITSRKERRGVNKFEIRVTSLTDK